MGLWKTIKMLLKKLIRNIVYLIVGLIYANYKLIKSFNNIIAKLFIKLPRIQKVMLIYLLVINFGIDVYNTFHINTYKKYKEVAYKDKVTTQIPKLTENIVIEEGKEEKCVFDSISCKIHEKGKEIGLNEEQILISIAISKWETGNYTSKLFKENNNVGGMYCNGNFIKYNSLEEGIEKFLINLKSNYFDIGLDTIEKIQPKYCPIGAANDPNGLNKNWIPGVTKFYNELRSSK